MLSAILPVHNEAAIVAQSVAKLEKALDLLGTDYEIILCEDGSSDGSGTVARKLAQVKSGKIRALVSEKRLGRGLALANALRAARGDVAIYMDADLATNLSHVKELSDEIERGADISTGSRLVPGSMVRGRSRAREFFSRAYNLLLRLLFRTSVHDHQCGFKAFRLSSVLPLLGNVKNAHWFWDSELLIRAQAAGLTVSEMPVEWSDRKKSSVQLQSDILQMGMSALLLRIRMWLGN
jgi:hypothetical protein